MDFSPDTVVLGTWDLFGIELILNLTIATTWLVIAVAVLGSIVLTRSVGAHRRDADVKRAPSRGQVAVEVIIELIEKQIAEISGRKAGRFLPFVGTLFIFIALSNLLLVVPGFTPPTASLSTTTALAFAVLLAVPVYAVGERGLLGYLGNYVRPTPLMLPFNLIGEASRTLALAIRLYGNVMSGSVIAVVLVGVAPLFLPVVMDGLGLITGVIQAYIFAILAMVYIAAAVGPEPPNSELTNMEPKQ